MSKISCRLSIYNVGLKSPLPGGVLDVRAGRNDPLDRAMLKPEAGSFCRRTPIPWSGWMEGALWSGDRVAQEITQQ